MLLFLQCDVCVCQFCESSPADAQFTLRKYRFSSVSSLHCLFLVQTISCSRCILAIIRWEFALLSRCLFVYAFGFRIILWCVAYLVIGLLLPFNVVYFSFKTSSLSLMVVGCVEAYMVVFIHLCLLVNPWFVFIYVYFGCGFFLASLFSFIRHLMLFTDQARRPTTYFWSN